VAGLPATITGAAIGGVVAQISRAAGTTALAGFFLALGPGHNIPLLGGTPAAGKELATLGVVTLVASVVLVACHARLRQYAAPTRPVHRLR
jgi:hypothetical protein